MNRFLLYAVIAPSAIAVTSCVDDNYDLSDIDTTAKIQVSDLTLPVNIEPITLSSIFDIDPTDPDATIKEINGSYAVVKNGTFSSSEIRINPVMLSGMSGEAVSVSIPTGVGGQTPSVGMKVSLPISSNEIDYSYSSSNVPAEIVSIDRISGQFRLSFSLAFENLESISRITLRNLQIQLPKGLQTVVSEGYYDAATGMFSLVEKIVTDGNFTLSLDCSGIDYAQSGAVFNPNDHSARLEGSVKLVSGDIGINGADVIGPFPSQIGMTTSFAMSDINVDKFSGEINYDITGVDISDVSLDDLPDVLSQQGTSIKLANPQIYLNISNPLSAYGLGATTGMSITSHFLPEQATPDATYSLDAPGYFTVSSEASSSYVLSPSLPSSLYPGYSNPLHVPYTSLSSVLSGNGLPSYLSITLNSPRVFTQPVVDLPLGTSLGVVGGNYEFFAPLAFNEGSQLVYTETENGWNDEDVDAITIEKLVVTTTVSSSLPFSVDLTGYPIDIEGKQIENVIIEGASVPANASNQEVTIRITGEVKHLDGIIFTAKGRVPADMQQAISPSQSLDCKDIRATVSGFYLKEL